MPLSEQEELELLELEREKAMKPETPKITQLHEALPDLSKVNLGDQAKSFVINALQGASLNATPYVAAIPASMQTGVPYGESVKQIRSKIDEATAKAPEAGTAGNITGSIASSVAIPALSIPGKVGKYVAPIAKDFLQGVTSGALGSRAEDINGTIEDAIKSGSTQAAFGVALKPVSALLKKLPSRKEISSSLDKFANMQALRSLGINKVGISSLGEKKASELGDFALKNKIVTPFSSLEDMMVNNQSLQKSSGENIGKIYNQLDEAGVKFNPLNVIAKSEADKGIQNIRRFSDFANQRGPINKAHSSLESLTNNPSLGEGWNYNKVLGDIIYNGKKYSNPRVNTEALGTYKNNLSDEIMSSATEGSKRLGLPDLGNELKKSNKTFNMTSLADEGLMDKYASKYGNKGAFGLTNTIAGSAAATRGSNPGEGLSNFIATITGKRALENYGPTTTATASKALSHAIGKDSPIRQLLDKAKLSGNVSKLINNAPLPINHFILMQSDPEYQKAQNAR